MEVNKSQNAKFSTAFSGVQGNVIPPVESEKPKELVGSAASLATRAYAMPQLAKKSDISFEGRYDKMVALIKNSPNPSKVQLRYDEVNNILEHLGYQVRHHSGSHFVATIANGQPITVVYPHGHEKFVNAGAISDIKKVLVNKNYVGRP